MMSAKMLFFMDMLDLLDSDSSFPFYEEVANLFDCYDDDSSSSSENEEQECMSLEASIDVWGACRDGNLPIVKRLITIENVNSIFNGETPLIAACAANRLKVAQYLIKKGADVLEHGEDPRGNYYPLHTACIWSSPALVKCLLKNGADKHVNESAYGKIPIYETYRTRKDRSGVEILNMLVKAGAEVDAVGTDGNTLLLQAVRDMRLHEVERPLQVEVRIIKVLLEAGADPNRCNINGDHPLVLSIRFPNIFRLLVEHGANVSSVGLLSKSSYNMQSIHVKCFEILLEYNAGVDINCKHENNQCDDLHCFYDEHRAAGKRVFVSPTEAHFIKMDAAGLYFGTGTCDILRPGRTLLVYTGKLLEHFRDKCKAELAKMSKERIGKTGATYRDVLYQRRWALMRVELLPLKTCQAAFPIYGSLIRSRFVMGRMKLPLMNKCTGFFELTDLPYLPPPCVAEILSYLSVGDLKNVISAHEPQKEKEDIQAKHLTEPQPGQSADGAGAGTSKGVEPTADGGSTIRVTKHKSSECSSSSSSEPTQKRILVDTGSSSSRREPGLLADGGSAISEPQPGPSSG